MSHPEGHGPKTTARASTVSPKPKPKQSDAKKFSVPPQTISVRRSIGEWEKASYTCKLDEATACAGRAKQQLNAARNLKGELKIEAFKMLDRLLEIVKKLEMPSKTKVEKEVMKQMYRENSKTEMGTSNLKNIIEEHSKVLGETVKEMDRLRTVIRRHEEKMDDTAQNAEKRDGGHSGGEFLAEIRELKRLTQETRVRTDEAQGVIPSYAEVLSRPPAARVDKPKFSVIVGSKNVIDTSADVIEKLRGALDARRSGLKIERLRRVRDAKVVLSCASKEEMEKLSEQLKNDKNLTAEVAKNKKPLVVLKNLMAYNTDDDIRTALAEQNRHLLEDLSADETAVEVRYRRRARNQQECHAVLQVSPELWQRLTSAGRVYIDLQHVRVQDQSPLVQCTRCLAYGHGRKQCADDVDLCNYCGGPHLKSSCTQLAAAQAPKCINCTRAKLTETAHTAFGDCCPVRRKWDALARAAIAYG